MKFVVGEKVRCLKTLWSNEEINTKAETGKVYTVLETGPKENLHEHAITLSEVKGRFWEWNFEPAESHPTMCRKCKEATHHVHRLTTKYMDSDMFLGIELCCKCFFEAEKVLQSWLKQEEEPKEEKE